MDTHTLAPIAAHPESLPRTRCVVLVDSIPQQRALAATRADAVLLAGLPAAELLAVITQVRSVS